MAPTLRLARGMFLAAVTFTIACSDEPAGNGDAGAPPLDASDDVSAIPDGAQNDAVVDATRDVALVDAASDVLSDGASTDGDNACTCTVVDAGAPSPLPGNGVTSLPCYCAMPWPGFPGAPPCASYEATIQCGGGRPDFGIETYTNCNFVTVRYSSGFPQEGRVFDHTTHEFVGAFRGTDHSLPCGASQAFLIQSGVVPGPECQTASVEWPCADAGESTGDAGDAAPPDDADGGCECVLSTDQGGSMPLSCYCARGGCLPYDAALTRCGPDSVPEFNTVDDYEACNLVVIESGTSIPGGGSLVYDRMTHELVGAAIFADYPGYECGDAAVFGYRAGRFPPPGCTRSRRVSRCPRDGGGG